MISRMDICRVRLTGRRRLAINMDVNAVCGVGDDGQATEGLGVTGPSGFDGMDVDTLYQAVTRVGNANPKAEVSERQPTPL